METDEKRWEGRPDGQESAPSVDVSHEGYARSPIREQTARAKQRAREKGSELEETAGRKVDELKESAVRRTDELTTRMGGRVETLARALRRAGDGMREEGEPRFAEMTDRAANGVERFGSYLEGQNPREMMEDIERSARSHPAYFVAGSFAVGMLIGRFLRSGEPETSEEAR
jgi:hypothetical protein